MAHIVILGAGTGGTPAAYEMRHLLDKSHTVTLINASDTFQFVPSHPWVALGWREAGETTFKLRPYLEKKHPVHRPARRHDRRDPRPNPPGQRRRRRLRLPGDRYRSPARLRPGAWRGPGRRTHGIDLHDGARRARVCALSRIPQEPRPVVIGALSVASCFGPVYEYAMAPETDLRRRKLRHKVPITYVSSEPYVEHLGLRDVGDSKGLLKDEFRQRHIKWITNAKTTRVEAGKMHVEEFDDFGDKVREHTVDFHYAMMLPPFRGVAAVAAVEGLCNPGGFMIVDEHQRSPKYPNIYSAGVCIAIPPVEQTPVATGTPKIGYMIERHRVSSA